MIMQYVVAIGRPKDYSRLEAIKVSKNAYLAKTLSSYHEFSNYCNFVSYSIK